MQTYLSSLLAMDRQREMISQASQRRIAREARAARRAAQPGRRSRLAIRFPRRLTTCVVRASCSGSRPGWPTPDELPGPAR
jgi:hypothetical protein